MSYQDLELEANEKAYDYNADDIYQEQRNNLDNILYRLGGVVLSYLVVDSVLAISNKEKRQIKSEFDKLFRDIIKSESDLEKKKTTEILTNATSDNYYLKSFLINTYYDINVKKLNKKDIEKIISGKIEGVNYNDRISKNKDKLNSDLNKLIDLFLDGKISVNDIEKAITDKYGYNAYKAKSLIETEISRVIAEANDKFAEENGIEYQMYMATLDNKTCPICARDDGKVFRRDDSNKPKLPRHTGDRCCYVNLPNKDWKPNSRMDNISKEHIDYKAYEEWKRQFD